MSQNNLNAPHLKELFKELLEGAAKARSLGLPKHNPAPIDRDLASYRAYMTQEDFLALQQEAERLELDIAIGQEPRHDLRLQVIKEVMNAGPWTLHPDYGCILKSEVNQRDRATERV